MITLQGMAEHRFTSVYYIYQCLFIGEIFSPLIFFLFLFRAVMFIRCYLSIPHRILSVIVDINEVIKTKYTNHRKIVGKK